MFLKSLVCLFVAAVALAQDYANDQTAREQQLAPNYARQSYNPDLYESARAEPYDFGFQSTDEFGTIMNRQETSDNSGAVRGSYGYTDPFGVFRHVDYVADEFGFRAEVKSNEPGMGTQSPANVNIYAEPPPAGVIIERPYYHPNHIHAPSGQQQGSGARRTSAGSASSPSGRQVRPVTRALYPYVAPQQNAFSSNALTSNQYPSTVSSEFSNQYPATVSNQYAANSAAASNSASQNAASGSYQTTTSVYPARSSYGSQNAYAASQVRSAAGSSSASSAQKPIVAKPYDGPTYKVGNPHVTEYTKADREKASTIYLPTVVASGNAPTTLVKHIHTYPAAPAAAGWS